jgi:hypothetical protein
MAYLVLVLGFQHFSFFEKLICFGHDYLDANLVYLFILKLIWCFLLNLAYKK